jgi:Na+-driven multidrug efflux pump
MWSNERGTAMTILDNVYNVIYLGLLSVLLLEHDWIGIEEPNLTHLGILSLAVSILYLVMVLIFVTIKGWLAPYWPGLTQSLSLRNTRLVKTLLNMAVPLTFGGIVATVQWELLTIFAAHMGSPEVAAWALLGSIWNVFEYLPAGFNTAVELRVSRYLSQGNPGMAKVVAYKCLVYSMVAAATISVLFVILRHVVVPWYTEEVVIQDMLSDLILLVGIANVVMVVGVVSYSILCAQGRTRSATLTYVFLSFATTLPLSFYFVFVQGYDLQSLAFALIVGYSLSSLVLMVFLLTSNWKRYSEAVVWNYEKSRRAQDRLVLAKAAAKRNQSRMNDVETTADFYQEMKEIS